MKKLLLTTAACGLAFVATPALAAGEQGVALELGGFFKGYGAFVDQDNGAEDGATAVEELVETNDFDFIRSTEVHFGGETTLDNGLTVGAHIEATTDSNDSFGVQESYVYFSGGWGRVNFGAEDGAAYLLQVAAPSADSNIDGIRQYIQPVNYASLTQAGGANNDGTSALLEVFNNPNNTGVNIDYDQNITGYNDKLTYLSPIMNGFQLGLTYVPDANASDDAGFGVGTDDVADTFGTAYEAALRYEGQFNNVGVNFGAGFSHLELEESDFTGLTGALLAGKTQAAVGDASDDQQAWNVGLDLDFGAIGVGVVYKEDDAAKPVVTAATAAATSIFGEDEETLVIGADYTTGPFKFGASYFDQQNTFGITNLDTKRYSGGVTYTYGPGMTFRGSLGYIEHEGNGIGGVINSTTGANTDEADATYVTLGTQINF